MRQYFLHNVGANNFLKHLKLLQSSVIFFYIALEILLQKGHGLSHNYSINIGVQLLSKYDLTTVEGKKQAYSDYCWHDHAFLRKNFQNAHEISKGVWRSNQPSPEQLAVWKEKGIKTIINLRGDIDSSFTALEKDACQKLGLKLLFFKVESRGAPNPVIMRDLVKAFETAEYPILLHCKSGADRAGLASSLYKYLIDKVSIQEAKKQLSFKYLHVSAGKTGILGHFWNKFEKAHIESGIEFWDWVDNVYQRDKLFDDFKPTPVGSWITDNLLKRE